MTRAVTPEPARPGTRLRTPCPQCGARVDLRAEPPAVGAHGVCATCDTRVGLVGGRVRVGRGVAGPEMADA